MNHASMVKLIFLTLAPSFFAASSRAQGTTFDLNTPISVRSSTPGLCALGQILVRLDQTPGQNVYVCGASSNWVQVGGGSAAAAGDLGSFQVNQSGVLGGTKGLTWGQGPAFIGFTGSGENDIGEVGTVGSNTFIVQVDGLAAIRNISDYPDENPWNQTIGSAGTGYQVGDVVTIVQSGAQGGQLIIDSISVGGGVTGAHAIPGGTGYAATDSNLSTTGGHGSGFTTSISNGVVGDTFKWNKNGGAWTATGIVMIGDGVQQSLSDGFSIYFQHDNEARHALGDKWFITAGSGGQVYSQVTDPQTSPMVVLTGQGAGNTTTGSSYSFIVSFVTPDGETYGTAPVTVTVSDHTADGKILISALPTSTDARVLGLNLYANTQPNPPWHLVDFIPSGTSSYLYNLADSDLASRPVASPAFNNINTAGPWMYGNDGGATRCLQVFDYGLRLSQSCDLFYDSAFASNSSGNTVLGTVGGYDHYFSLHGTYGSAYAQLSDGTGTVNHAAIYNADGGLTDGPAGLSQTVVVKGSAGANCNLVFASGILASTTCP